jgi:nucleotide-binding universal stress UspA family protein
MLQHILVGLDGSPLAETILAYVSILSKALGAEVTLLHVVHLSEDMQRDEPYRLLQPAIQQAEAQAQDYLSRVAQRFTDSGIKVQNRVTIGDAATEVVRAAPQEGRDLIALATHGRSGLQRWFYGSVAEKVLHTTNTPVLLIRPTDEQAAASQELTQIIVPLDGSPLAEAALPLAETLATRANVPLILLRVVEVLSLDFGDPTGLSSGSYPQILESLQKATEDYLNQLAASLRGKGLSIQTEAPLGLPTDKIVGYAHEHPGSLVVMTTHGRTGFTGFVLGSVARRVVQHGNTPTLVVRSLVTPAAANPSATSLK